MESLNLKMLPFAILALVLSFLAFTTAVSLVSKIEILLDLLQVIMFILWFAVFISLASCFLALALSQVQHIYFKLGVFASVFLPYISVFLFRFSIPPTTMVAIIVLFGALVLSITMDFRRLYSNQIKTDLSAPARAIARSLIFFTALATAIVFLSVNNTEVNRQLLETKILDQINIAVTSAIEDYNLIEKVGGQMGTSQLTQTAVGRVAVNKMEEELNSAVSEQINTMVAPYMIYIVYIITILIFATIAGSSTLAGILTTLFGMLVIYILKSVGYMYETKEMVEVTRLKL